MVDLRLAKLPDRTPVKLTLHITPQLSDALVCYAELYRSAYGQEATVAELVPAMLETFMAADRAFMALRKK